MVEAVFWWMQWRWSCLCSPEATVRCVVFDKPDTEHFLTLPFSLLFFFFFSLSFNVFGCLLGGLWFSNRFFFFVRRWVFLGSCFVFYWMALFCFLLIWALLFLDCSWSKTEVLALFCFSFLFIQARYCVLSFFTLFNMAMLRLSWCIYSFEVVLLCFRSFFSLF